MMLMYAPVDRTIHAHLHMCVRFACRFIRFNSIPFGW